MTTSSSLATSRPLTRSEYVSTLPPWRRLLAMVNWRPSYDIEQRTRQHELNGLASEKRLKLLKIENKRLAELNSRMDAFLPVPIPPRRHHPQPALAERSPRGVAGGAQTAKGLTRAAVRESLASSESSRRQRPQITRQACGEKHPAGAHRRGRNVLRTHKLGGAFQSRVPGGRYASPLEHNCQLG